MVPGHGFAEPFGALLIWDDLRHFFSTSKPAKSGQSCDSTNIACCDNSSCNKKTWIGSTVDGSSSSKSFVCEDCRRFPHHSAPTRARQPDANEATTSTAGKTGNHVDDPLKRDEDVVQNPAASALVQMAAVLGLLVPRFVAVSSHHHADSSTRRGFETSRVSTSDLCRLLFDGGVRTRRGEELDPTNHYKFVVSPEHHRPGIAVDCSC